MNAKSLLTLGTLFAGLALGSARLAAAPAKPVVPPLSAAGERLLDRYEAQLQGLRAELVGALPKLDASQLEALQQIREEIKAAEAAEKAAQGPLDKITQGKGLVAHAKGKWLGGAEKGIAAAQEALKKATTDAERAAAQKDLEHWQKNKADGLQALAERQAALDAALAHEKEATQAMATAKARLAEAKGREQAAAQKLMGTVEKFLASDALDAKLAACSALVNASPRGLALFAEKGPEHEMLVEQLFKDPALLRTMLEAGGAKDGQYGEAVRLYAAIRKASPRAKEGVFHRLALAISLEHAVPVKQNNPAAETQAPSVVDPVKRYLHYEQAHLAGELDPAFKDLSAWELRNVVNGDDSDAAMAWGREMLRNYRPDHVLNPDMGWRYSRAVTTDVKYGSQNVKDDKPELMNCQNIIRNGGICGRRAFFGRFILRSFGIPTAARPQRGHAALARWTPKGWVVNLGAGWGSPDAKGVYGYTDEDFLTETQSRLNPAGYLKALRAQWAGDALGEEPYVSLRPKQTGPWQVLARFVKQDVAATVKAAPLAALGSELGEANESDEVRARALVKAKVTEEDKRVRLGADGVITLPAAACSGAQILGSFQGGHQLFSGGGVITCDFDAPRAGTYALSLRLVTVQDNPDLEVTVNQDKAPLAVALPCTVGKWEQTRPVLVNLVKGRNSLRFNRPAGSRGLSIREFTLTPAAATAQSRP
jgi:hypothetical protein